MFAENDISLLSLLSFFLSWFYVKSAAQQQVFFLLESLVKKTGKREKKELSSMILK